MVNPVLSSNFTSRAPVLERQTVVGSGVASLAFSGGKLVRQSETPTGTTSWNPCEKTDSIQVVTTQEAAYWTSTNRNS